MWSQEPAPQQVGAGQALVEVMKDARAQQKKQGDAYMSQDVLLTALFIDAVVLAAAQPAGLDTNNVGGV